MTLMVYIFGHAKLTFSAVPKSFRGACASII